MELFILGERNYCSNSGKFLGSFGWSVNIALFISFSSVSVHSEHHCYWKELMKYDSTFNWYVS